MRLHGLALPVRGRRRRGRRHEGQVECVVSNQRWCSDVLEIACFNGEVVHVVFAVDCCDREVMSGAFATVVQGHSGVVYRSQTVASDKSAAS
jgi:putative transposase